MQTQKFFRKSDNDNEHPSIYNTDLLSTGNRVALRADDSRRATVKHIFGRTIIVLFDGCDELEMVDDHLLIKLADKPNDPAFYNRTLI